MRIQLSIISALAALALSASEPSGYYSSCEGKNQAALLSALRAKVGPHTNVGYDGLNQVYVTSDADADGKFIDIYSTKHWNPGSKCGNYKLVGDCWNKEHSFPKSWFGGKTAPMYSDAFHLYPTDGRVNGQRSNFPYGECASGTTLAPNGSVRALGRLGSSSFPGYSGTVFEPDDQYKGDLARTYFYMAAAYNDKIASWDSNMLAGNSYPAFSPWAVNLLLKWSRQDPVSPKETARNEAIYAWQHNRNPFIDHPELAEYIWGDKKSQDWSLSATSDPAFVLPAAAHVYSMGTVAVGVPRSLRIPVKGVNIATAASASIQGSGFAIAAAALSAADINAGSAFVDITLTAPSAGQHSATLTLHSASASVACSVTATAVIGLPAGPARDIADDSFTATWTNIDPAPCSYSLTLLRQGETVQGYPVSVPNTAESYLVENLEPETTYVYTISNGSLTSPSVSVTTAAPVPSIGFLYDGSWLLSAPEGSPSEPIEVVVDADNIPGPITLAVESPFQVCLDKSSWANSVVIPADGDRFYLRLDACPAGHYTTSLAATAGDFEFDEVEIEGVSISATPTFVESFEKNYGATYSKQDLYQGDAADWELMGCYISNGSDSYPHDGNHGARTAASGDRYLTMLTDKPSGMGTLSLWAHLWSKDSGSSSFAVSTSVDGSSWSHVGTITVPATPDASGTNTYASYSLPINDPLARRLKIEQTAGKRTLLDDIALTDCLPSGLLGTDLDYHAWDAFCRAGALVIEAYAPGLRAYVYSVDGRLRLSPTLSTGSHSFSLAPGLYIVCVDTFSRRVVIP